MYKARLIGSDEKTAFDKFVAWAPKGHILQSFEWGELKGKGEWQPLRLVVENKEGKLEAAISILKRTIPLLRKAIFYAPRGPVGDVHNEKLMDFLFQEVRGLARRHGAIFLKIDPDISGEDEQFKKYLQSRKFISQVTGQGFEGIQPRFVFRLDISDDEENIFKRFHSKTRYNIRLAGRKGVEIKEDCGKEELPKFYKILQETTERDRFLVRSYQYFNDMWESLFSKGYLKLFMAYYEGQPIAGTLAFLFGDKAWYIYGASSNAYRNVMPNYLLQWTMIKWAKAKGCMLYDFRGVPGNLREDNPLYGLYRFKKGFEGDYVEFVGEYDLIFSSFYYRLWNTLEPLYQKNIRRLIGIKKKLKKRAGK